jgi:hypothetical protein
LSGKLTGLRTGCWENRIFFKGSDKNFSSFCSVLFRFLPVAALIFFNLVAELEVAATQTFEFADEVFWAAEVPALQGVYLPDRRN